MTKARDGLFPWGTGPVLMCIRWAFVQGGTAAKNNGLERYTKQLPAARLFAAFVPSTFGCLIASRMTGNSRVEQLSKSTTANVCEFHNVVWLYPFKEYFYGCKFTTFFVKPHAQVSILPNARMRKIFYALYHDFLSTSKAHVLKSRACHTVEASDSLSLNWAVRWPSMKCTC